jgi:hypothetical protein
MAAHTFNLHHLLLTRLLAGAPKDETLSTLKTSLAPLFAEKLSKTEWNTLVQRELRLLCDTLEVERTGHQRCKLSDCGQQVVLDFLGLDKVPAKHNWETLKNVYLVSDALDLPRPDAEQRKRIASPNGLRAAVLRHSFALPVPEYPTYAEAKRALLWQQFGALLGKPLSSLARSPFPGKAAALMLNEMVEPERPPEKVPSLDKVIDQLIAKLLGAKRPDANSLRLALIRDRLAVDVETGPDSHGFRLEDFAAQVLLSARASEDRRFGEDKVLIAQVWREFKAGYNYFGLDQKAFKQQLLQANQQGLLRLSRADLAAALPAEELAASEIAHLHATFHFVQV